VHAAAAVGFAKRRVAGELNREDHFRIPLVEAHQAAAAPRLSGGPAEHVAVVGEQLGSAPLVKDADCPESGG
jgi:hypothetical protein